jgi:hypothetical protein
MDRISAMPDCTLRGASGARRAWTENGMIEDVSAGLDAVTAPVTVVIGESMKQRCERFACVQTQPFAS